MRYGRGLFVVGTDTGVGKTRVAAAIARSMAGRGLGVGVLKPMATGSTLANGIWKSEDAEALIAAIGGGVPAERVCPLHYEEPLAPAVAARRQGSPLSAGYVFRAVRDALAWWTEQGTQVLVVEGAGGLLTPLADDLSVADLAVALDFPLVIVARRGLGTLNHTLMTVECARRRGLRCAGLVLSTPVDEPPGPAEATNALELTRLLPDIPLLADLGFHAEESSFAIALDCMEWYDRACSPRGTGLFSSAGGVLEQEIKR